MSFYLIFFTRLLIDVCILFMDVENGDEMNVVADVLM